MAAICKSMGWEGWEVNRLTSEFSGRPEGAAAPPLVGFVFPDATVKVIPIFIKGNERITVKEPRLACVTVVVRDSYLGAELLLGRAKIFKSLCASPVYPHIALDHLNYLICVTSRANVPHQVRDNYNGATNNPYRNSG